MKWNIIKSEIAKGLKKGKSKNELYEEYKQSVDDTLLRRILASNPCQDTKKKFRIIHKIICWIWVLFFILELLGSLELFTNFDLRVLISLIISAYFVVQLWKFNGDIYLPGIFWLVWGIFNNIKEIVELPKDDLDYNDIILITWSYTLLLVTTISLMWIVRKNVFGYYNWFKPAHDQNNRIRFQEE